MIEAELREAGMDASADPAHLAPNTGYWRTDWRADVMPWMGKVELRKGGDRATLLVGSWATMTDLLRGFTWTRDGGEITLHALHEKEHPKMRRRKA